MNAARAGLRLLVALALLAGGAAAAAAGVEVRDAWVREPPPVARVVAVYLVLENTGVADALVSASSPAATRVELHQSRLEGEVMRMAPVERIELAPGERIDFAESGHHLMLYVDDAAPLRAGTRLAIELAYASGTRRTLEAEVRDGTAVGSHDHHHAH